MIEKLMEFNLTRQEASVYLILCSNPSSTGYEIAKLSGISRSNTYAALSSLTDKGGARLLEGQPSRYSAVPIEEFCENKIRLLNSYKRFLSKNLPAITNNDEGYMTIYGDQNILDTVLNMVKSTELRIYISISGMGLRSVEEDLIKLINEGKKVVLITNPPFKLPGAIVYHAVKPANQIRIIVDSDTVLTGDIGEGKNSTCLYSRRGHLIDVFKESLKNEIKLFEILNK